MCYQPTIWKVHGTKHWVPCPYTAKHWPRKSEVVNLDGTRHDGARPAIGSHLCAKLEDLRQPDHWKIYSVGIMLHVAPHQHYPHHCVQALCILGTCKAMLKQRRKNQKWSGWRKEDVSQLEGLHEVA